MSRIILLLAGSALSVSAKFDFNVISNSSCVGGFKSFDLDINEEERAFVGDIPPGLTGLLIQLRSNSDIDLQLSSGSNDIINWKTGIINESHTTSRTWNNDSITYSGYSGDGSGAGNEYIQFDDSTDSHYNIYAYGYTSGSAIVNFTWNGNDDCIGEVFPPEGKGAFSQSFDAGQVLWLGELPKGLQDIYIRVISESNIDLQLYDGDIAVVDSEAGLLNGKLIIYHRTLLK
jgi:hypothetical protein